MSRTFQERVKNVSLSAFLATGLIFLILRRREEMNKEFPHTDIYDNNLTLINVTTFKFVINNDICNVQRVALVTIIHTAVDNHEARSNIRSENSDVGLLTQIWDSDSKLRLLCNLDFGLRLVNI